MLEHATPGLHMHNLEDEVDAEVAQFLEAPASLRTKMVLPRALERNKELDHGEDLVAAWKKSLASLQARAGPFLADP